MSDLYEFGEARRRKVSKVWTYPQTLPLNAPWEKSFYTAKQIKDVEEYWNRFSKRREQ